jgi:flagellar protein FlbD
VIVLTRLSGSSFVLNCDLIERIDSTPDTVVSLVDGKKYVVQESPTEVVRAVRGHRGEILAVAQVVEQTVADQIAAALPAPRLSAVTPIARED